MKLGEFELDQAHTGDAAIELAKLPDACIDLTVTSPPYDNLRTYNGYTLDFESIARQLYRVTKQGGVVVWVVGDATVDGNETGTSFRQALFFKECGFNLHDTMIWEKSNFGHPSNNRYHQLFEYVFIFSAGIPKSFNPIKDKKNGWAGSGTFGENTLREADGSMGKRKRNIITEFGMRGNVWKGITSGQEDVCEEKLHPATFPEWLARDHILSWSNPGDVVLDPMCGSGTTLKQAHELGRHFIGFDISGEYIEKIVKPRLQGARIPLEGLLV